MELKFRKRGEEDFIEDSSGLLVGASGYVRAIYQDEDESGTLQNYYNDEPDIEAIILDEDNMTMTILTPTPAEPSRGWDVSDTDLGL